MYKLFFYDDINTTDSELEHIKTFTGKIELHPLISIDIDEDKFIDEEFFSFEAKRMELKFVDDGSPLAGKFKEILNCKDYLLRQYPRTLEGITTAPTETQFINRKLKVDINNNAAFIGVPNIAAHSVNYETMEHTVEFVSLPYLLFDNMESFDMSMLLSYIANEYYKNYTGVSFKLPCVLIEHLLLFLFNNGIKTHLLNYIIDGGAVPVLFNNALLLYSNNDFGKQYTLERGVYSIEQFNGFNSPYLALNSLTKEDGVYHLQYHQTFKTKSMVPVELRFGGHLLSYDPIYLTFRSEKEVTINPETMECFEYDNALITVADVANTVFLNDIFIALQSKYNMNISIRKKNNVINKVKINFTLKTQDKDRDHAANLALVQNNFMTTLIDKLDDLYTRSDDSNIVFSNDNNNTVTFTAHTGYPKITVSGEVQPKIKIDIKDDKHGGKLITNSSNGIFNPDKFNIKDFFKYMLALSGSYMRLGYKNGKTLIAFEPFKIDPLGAIRLRKEDILKLSSKNTFIKLNKEFNDMDYSETDWHYLIRAVVFMYKSLAGALKSVYSCELLKTVEMVQAGLGVGKSVFIMLDSYKKTFFINSIKEEEDIYELELVEYLSDKQIPDILKQENIIQIIY